MKTNRNYKNMFEVDNARNERPETLPSQFVWTPSMERLVSAKNHIVLGARGSGKTAILKMLTHQYLSKSQDPNAIKIIGERKFIGTYLATSVDWVGALKNKDWISEEVMEKIFRWRLNIASIQAFLDTAESCLNSFVADLKNRVEIERKLSQEFSESLFTDCVVNSFLKLREKIEDYEYALTPTLGKFSDEYSSDKLYSMELFFPFKRLVTLLKRRIRLHSSAIWIVCIDEAEFLNESQHRVLNTFLRSDSGNIFFKISTLPYQHHTLDTNLGVPIVNKHDFEYIYIDNTFASSGSATNRSIAAQFVDSIFQKRIAISKIQFKGDSLKWYLGRSKLLMDSRDDPDTNWDSPNSSLYGLLEKYGTDRTRKRAKELRYTAEFHDQIGRKLKGALYLVDAISSRKGNSKLDIYSGYEMLVTCTDGNPRSAISLINQLLLAVPGSISSMGMKPIPAHVQTRVFEAHGSVLLNRIQGNGSQGTTLEGLIKLIGNEFHQQLHEKKLGTDTIGTIRVTESNEEIWEVIKSAVGEGLLYPIVNSSNPDILPVRIGSFRLAYALAPKFRLLPRKGSDVTLNKVFSNRKLLMSTLSRESQDHIAQLKLEL